jgi:hypothetical protein
MPLKTICKPTHIAWIGSAASVRRVGKNITVRASMPSDDNGKKGANLCCRSRPNLVEGVITATLRDDVLRDGGCDEHDRFASRNLLPVQFAPERDNAANYRMVALWPLAPRVGEPR